MEGQGALGLCWLEVYESGTQLSDLDIIEFWMRKIKKIKKPRDLDSTWLDSDTRPGPQVGTWTTAELWASFVKILRVVNKKIIQIL